jgi:phosphoribosylformylglycinamidine synthase
VSSAHDLSEGGLAQALVECCLIGGRGAEVSLPAGADPFVALFSESAARMVVTVPPAELARFTARCEAHGVPVTELGEVSAAGADLVLAGLGTLSRAVLTEAWTRTLPAIFDEDHPER